MKKLTNILYSALAVMFLVAWADRPMMIVKPRPIHNWKAPVRNFFFQPPPTTSTTTIGGRNAVVTLPDGYADNPSLKYPTIVFFPGLGETGTTLSRLYLNGPHNRIMAGLWDGSVSHPVTGANIPYILISLQTKAWAEPSDVDAYVAAIKAAYRVDTNSFHVTGLSAGKFSWQKWLVSTAPRAHQVSSMVLMSFGYPEWGDGANAVNCLSCIGIVGTLDRYWWGFEGNSDRRGMDEEYDLINSINPGNARYTLYTGGHGGWNAFYNETYKENIGGVQTSIYQYMLTHPKATTGGNQSPTANAGSDQAITLPTSSVALSGSGNDPDGTISSYAWTKLSGPSSFTIVSPTSASTNVTGLTQGTYIFRLTVTDNGGATAFDDVAITVNPTTGGGLNANAGADRSIRFPLHHQTLSAAASTDDGTITAWSWAKIAGPASYKIVTPDQEKTVVTDLAVGTYQFELTVTDNAANTDKDTVQITVAAVKTDCAGSRVTFSYTYSRDYSLLLSPGDTLVIPAGTYSMHIATGINGTESCPIVIINQGGRATFEAWNFELNNSHIKFTGTGDPATAFGFKMGPSNYFGMHLKLRGPIEIDHVEVTGTNLGIQYRDNEVSGDTVEYAGLYMHNLWIHHINGNEGLYIGNSSTSAAPKIKNFHAHDILIDRTDRDGFQTSNAHNVLIERIKILNPSQIDPDFSDPAQDGQRHAFTMGHDVQGVARDLYITQPPEYGIFTSGGAIVIDCATIKDTASQGLLAMFGKNYEFNPSTWNETYQQFTFRNISLEDAAGVDQVSLTVEGPIRASKVEHIKINAGNGGPLRWNPSSGGVTANVTDVGLNATFSNGCVPPTSTTLWTTDWPASSPGVGAPPINQVPFADAGANKTITLPTNSTTLTGSASDLDGTIASYAWTQVSGPNTATIVSASSASTNITGMIQGTYVFRLTVTDNSGGTATDDVQVTVAAGGYNRTYNTRGRYKRKIFL